MVTLYHGTTSAFEVPDLNRSRRGMDFGSGFYLTPNRVSAERWAKKVSYLRRADAPVVLAFQFDEDGARAAGLIRNFPVMNRDWVGFVLANRTEDFGADVHNLDRRFDIVHGYIADDRLMQIIDDFSRGDLSMEEVETRLANAPVKTAQKVAYPVRFRVAFCAILPIRQHLMESLVREEKQRQIVETLRTFRMAAMALDVRFQASGRWRARRFASCWIAWRTRSPRSRECLLDAPLVVRRSTKGVFLRKGCGK